MPKDLRIKPEQIVMLLLQVEILTVIKKTLAQAYKEIGNGLSITTMFGLTVP